MSLASSSERLGIEAEQSRWWARFNLVARYSILIQASLTAFLVLAAGDISSISGAIHSFSANAGHYVLAATVLAGWADIVVNDFPHRFAWKWIKTKRLLLFSLLSLAYLLEAFVGLSSTVPGKTAVIVYYVGAAVAAGWVALLQVVRHEAASI